MFCLRLSGSYHDARVPASLFRNYHYHLPPSIAMQHESFSLCFIVDGDSTHPCEVTVGSTYTIEQLKEAIQEKLLEKVPTIQMMLWRVRFCYHCSNISKADSVDSWLRQYLLPLIRVMTEKFSPTKSTTYHLILTRTTHLVLFSLDIPLEESPLIGRTILRWNVYTLSCGYLVHFSSLSSFYP